MDAVKLSIKNRHKPCEDVAAHNKRKFQILAVLLSLIACSKEKPEGLCLIHYLTTHRSHMFLSISA